MAGTTTHTTLWRTKVADLMLADLGTTGRLVYRASPSTANTPGATVASLALSNPAGASATLALATFSAITSDTNATAGTIAYATLQTGAGVVIVHTTVGTGAEGLNITSGGLAVSSGDTVSCSSLTYTAMP
jgi:hypothetical protein